MKFVNLAVLTTTFHFTNSLPLTDIVLEDQNAISKIPEITKFEISENLADDDSLVDRSRRSLRHDRKHRRSKKERRRKEKEKKNRRRRRNKDKKNKKDRRLTSNVGFHKLKSWSLNPAPTHDRIRKHLSDFSEPTTRYRRPQVPCFRGLDRLSSGGFACGLYLS
ncbi:Oidioi.mRNA.OKI2018_I69.PAR.g8529.t2.cds [Oikopleura dioica]|uniref:Oidioi.mRNA.OKI2018_I69.PAR.g8529.t2.cds n=1 Tax=Oikopleura dioica TaxID=34765 RepID=A0ABN7RHG9_OIKDI|nr:Oidioi.mRNA.OKI2018_I69.PAR.g8529.t2.cds [Oikopleura dioica]